MNKNIIYVVVLISCSTLVWLWITKSNRTNQTASSEPVPQSPIEEASFLNRDASVLPPERIEAFQNVSDDMKQVLLAAPDDLTGKKSPWYKTLTECQIALEQAAKTGTRKELFGVIPPSAKFFARDREIEDLSYPLADLRHRLEVSGVPIIKEIAKVVSENNGKLDGAAAEFAVQVFSVHGFANEPDWEEESAPIDSAGVLIARPEIMPFLEALPVEQLDIYLSAQKVENFFWRYAQDAEGTPKRDRRYYGMPILRQRYSENREALHECYNKLAAKVAPHRAKLYGEEQE